MIREEMRRNKCSPTVL